MATTTEIQTLYVAYFNRPADPLGLQSWLATGKSVAEIAAGFSASNEYSVTYAGKTPLDLVNSIYMNLFGRAAESAGLLYWAGKLTAGTETFASIALTIANSAQEADLTAINNKVAAAGNFTDSLDTAADLLGYDGAAANAVAKAWLATITTDATFTAGTTATALQAVADAASAAHSGTVNNPLSLVLTAGVDTIVGGAGNDTIAASNTGTATATLTGLDSIDGGAGKDTLNISDTDGAAASLDLSIVSVKNVEVANVVSTGSLKGNAADVTGWTGLTNANFTLKSIAVQTVTAAATTAVSVSNTAGVTVVGGSSINVTAGSSVASLTALANAITTASDDGAIDAAILAAVNANGITSGQGATIKAAYLSVSGAGVAGTTAAEVTAGKAAIAALLPTYAALAVNATTNTALASATVKGGSTVTIIDGSTALDQLKSVSLDGNVGAAALTGKALTAVTVANTNQNVIVTNATASHTQSVTLTNVKGGTIQDAAATTLNIAATTTKSSGVTFSAAEATKVNVAAAVDLSTTLTTVKATSVVVTGAGKVTVAGASLDAAAVIDASGSTGGVIVSTGLGVAQNFIGGAGKDTVSIALNTKTINLGAGDDTVILTDHLGVAGKVDGGAGNDTIAGTAAVLSALNAADAAGLVNFETFKVTDALAAGSYDVSQVAGVVNFVAGAGVVGGAVANATGLGANANVSILGAATNGTLNLALKTDTTADVVNVTLGHGFTVNDDATSSNANVATIVGAQLIETVNIISTGTPTIAPADLSVGSKADTITNVLTLNDDALVTLKVSGDQAFSITTAASQVKLATIDASANTAGATIDATANTIALTIKGTAKADVITGGTLGDTITGGGGNDTFKFVAAGSSIGTGKFDTITDFVANTYGNAQTAGVDNGGAGTGANGTAAKLTGDILSFVHNGTGAGGVVVDVLTSAADASTYLANNKGANVVVAALDSSNSNLYVDNTGDGVADFYIHLTGVTTINAAAFTLS